MNVKTTLELPAPLLHQVKVAALNCHTTMKDFFCDALKEKLAKTPQLEASWYQSPMPPPPKVAFNELKALNKKILAAAAEIHPGDWE